MSSYNTKKKRNKRNNNGKFVTAALVLIVIAVLIGVSAFIRISEIEVIGAVTYTDEEIVSFSGIQLGDNLLLLNESNAAISICRGLPYVDEVSISRELPDRIEIIVTESVPLAYVKSGGAFWKLDKKCKLLERVETGADEDLLELRGVEPISPSVGQIIALGVGEETRLLYIQNVLAAIYDRGLAEKTTYLDAEKISRLEFGYDDRYTVKIGFGNDVEAKFTMLLERVLNDLGESDRGIIDITDASEAHFIPE